MKERSELTHLFHSMRDVGVYWTHYGMDEDTTNMNEIVNGYFNDRYGYIYYTETEIMNKLCLQRKPYGGKCKTSPNGCIAWMIMRI